MKLKGKDVESELNGVDVEDGEEFKQIPDYPHYWVSNHGRVWNNTSKKLLGHQASNGYVMVSLYNDDGMLSTCVHNLVMEAFGTPCPDGCRDIDHMNKRRDDNSIKNLRWVSHSTNQRNRTGWRDLFEYFDEIPANPEDIHTIESYGRHKIKDYYYADGYVYFNTGFQYRRLVVKQTKSGYAYVNMLDVNGKNVAAHYHKLKRILGVE